jgi:hypothetical protein
MTIGLRFYLPRKTLPELNAFLVIPEFRVSEISRIQSPASNRVPLWPLGPAVHFAPAGMTHGSVRSEPEIA